MRLDGSVRRNIESLRDCCGSGGRIGKCGCGVDGPQFLFGHGETGHTQDEIPQLDKTDAFEGVEGEYLVEDVEAFFGDGEDTTEEVGIFEEGVEGFIGGRGYPPGIPTANEVDEDHTEGPDVALLSGILGVGGEPVA